MLSLENEKLIKEYLDIAENDSENGERFANILSDDCVWTLMPPGIAIMGGESVNRFCSFAMGSRKHKGNVKAKINNWFADEDKFCVEYYHAAIISIFKITVIENVCLVCKMRNGKFCVVNEYVDTSGSKLIWFGLKIMPLIARIKGIKFKRSLTRGTIS
jgi:ketosteroid isomerase-like protein